MFTKIFTSLLMTLIAIGGFFVNVGVEKENNGSVVGFNIEYSQNTYAADEGSVGEAEAAKAMEKKTQSNESTKVKEFYNNIVAFLNLILGVLTIIVSPAVMLSSWLMSPDWTSGDLFGLRGVMYKLWVTMSNITYFIYAILLIFIALATIFGKESYAYKAMLPKLALGIILVPFTWWFIQFTISLATIVTASVISIPHETLMSINDNQKGWWTTPVIPSEIEITGENFGKELKTCKEIKCISPETFLTQSSGMYGYMMVYAYGVFKVQELKQINTVTDNIKTITQIIHQSIVGVIMFIVFGILTLALIFMLMARAVMLWVYTIFSPFLTLELVMGGMMKKVSEDFSIKEFIGLAFVPALVGLSLSFGLVVIAAVQTPKTGNNVQLGTTNNGTCDAIMIIGEGCKIGNIMGNPNNELTRKLTQNGTAFISTNTLKFGGVNFIYKGKATGADDAAKGTSDLIGIIGGAGSIFGTIIVDIIALLFIWMAFMAAKGVSKVVGAAAKPFEDMGNSIGKLGASLPKYMPLPVPGGSLSGMQKTVELSTDKFRTSHDQKTLENIGQMFPNLVKGAMEPKNLAEHKENIRSIRPESLDSLEKAGKSAAKLQSTTEYSNANYETVKQSLKDIGWNEEQIKTQLNAKGINDSRQRELLTKLYTGVDMNDTEKRMAWDLNKEKFGGASSSKDSSSTTNNNTFNIIDNGGGKFSLKSGEFELSGKNVKEISDELLKKPEKLVNVPEAEIKKQLEEMKKDGMDDATIDKIIKAVNEKRVATANPAPATPATPPAGTTH